MPPKKVTQGTVTTATSEPTLAIVSEEAARSNAEAVAKTHREANVPPDGVTIFVSSKEEAELYDIGLGVEENEQIHGLWDQHLEHVVWRVPNDLVERFSRHAFVIGGRILKAE